LFISGDVLMSLFVNELYGFQLDSRRWWVLFQISGDG